jgi:hypothetical protein
MNQYEMVAVVIVVIMLASVLKARFKYQGKAPADGQETLRMREEVRTLKERIAVLERIATDKESVLEREIEQLRDR